MPKPTKWLSRRAAHPGPYMTLALTEKAFTKAVNLCKVPVHQQPNWLHSPTCNATTHFIEHPTDGNCIIVAIRPANPNLNAGKLHHYTVIAGLLAHEAVHIADSYFESIGERTPASEQKAYAVQAFFQTLLEEYERQTKKAKKG